MAAAQPRSRQELQPGPALFSLNPVPPPNFHSDAPHACHPGCPRHPSAHGNSSLSLSQWPPPTPSPLKQTCCHPPQSPVSIPNPDLIWRNFWYTQGKMSHGFQPEPGPRWDLMVLPEKSCPLPSSHHWNHTFRRRLQNGSPAVPVEKGSMP